MCGRYSNKKTLEFFRQDYYLDFSEKLEWRPSYNIAPTQNALVTTADNPKGLELMHFGLVPFWSKDRNQGFKMINARAETVLDLKSYKPLFKQGKRCIVYADSFFEWQKQGKEKQPFRIKLTEKEVFTFAGLWSLWKSPDGEDYYSFTIITTQPNELTSVVHDRMPVILTQEEQKAWLDKDNKAEDLMPLLNPFPADAMEMYPVSKDVGNVRNNHEGLLNSL